MKNVILTAAAFVLTTSGVFAQQLEPADASPEFVISTSEDEARFLDTRIGESVYSLAWWENEDGDALFQGDINLGAANELEAAPSGFEPFGLIVIKDKYRWPNGKIRFMIAPDFPKRHRIYGAIAEWKSKTRITFEEIAKPSGDFILFKEVDKGCNSLIGKRGGQQLINVSNGCRQGNIIHEIGHAVGLHHEQARADQNSHIRIHWNRIIPAFRHNFESYASKYEDVGGYCYGSIMHYPKLAFAKGVFPTIEPLVSGAKIGQRRGLADCDIAAVHLAYELADDVEIGQPGFVGEPRLYPAGCEENRKCYLKNDVKFTDTNGKVWLASARDDNDGDEIKTGLTDGASIPEWAQPLVGQPYDREYLLSAIVHDHYSYRENRVRSWRQTQRMFYDALTVQGVEPIKAQVMYFAVLIGSRKWIKLVPGENCGLQCINDYETRSSNVRDGFAVLEEKFGSSDFLTKFEIGKSWIESNSGSLSLNDIDEFAAIVDAGNSAFQLGEEVRLSSGEDSVFN